MRHQNLKVEESKKLGIYFIYTSCTHPIIGIFLPDASGQRLTDFIDLFKELAFDLIDFLYQFSVLLISDHEFTSFFRWKIRTLILRPFFFNNIHVLCYKFSFENCFSCITKFGILYFLFQFKYSLIFSLTQGLLKRKIYLSKCSKIFQISFSY